MVYVGIIMTRISRLGRLVRTGDDRCEICGRQLNNKGKYIITKNSVLLVCGFCYDKLERELHD